MERTPQKNLAEPVTPPPKKLIRQIDEICRGVHQHLPPAHPNRKLRDDMVLAALLLAFHDPACRSQRLMDQMSQMPAVQEALGCSRIPRSTLSDALQRFDLSVLKTALEHLRKQLPWLKHEDAVLSRILNDIIAVDGTSLHMAGEVAWAMQRKKNKDGQIDSQAKAHVHLDVRRWLVTDLAVTGSAKRPGGASEQAVLGRMLLKNVIYLIDRGYCGFVLLQQMLEESCHFVMRLKKDFAFRPQESLPLSPKDTESGVLSDEIGYVGKADEQMSPSSPRRDKPPTDRLRVVTVWDPVKKEPVRLLTSLRDLEAWVIAYLYRCRWMIELYFRWLKITAGYAHLMSQSETGVTAQMYVAMIGTLLLYLQTGMPVSKYSLYAMNAVARGQATMDQMMPGLLRLERERMLARQRLARKKAEEKTKG